MTTSNKEIVLEVLTRSFNDRDPAVIAKMLPTLTALRYEPGMAVAEGDLVMVHGRYIGWGPKPMIAVDIFRVADGKVAEHWDVMQEEVPASATASGNPMFGD